MGTTPSIGIVGLRGDDEAESVARALAALGAEVKWLDFRGHPGRKLGFLSGAGGSLGVYDGVDLASLDACYIRQSGYNWPYPRAAEHAPRWREAYPAYLDFLSQEQQCLSYKECVLRLLSRRIPVVNPQPLQELHRLKQYQLQRLRWAGVPVAQTLGSNDSEALARFAASLEACVRKPQAGVLKTALWSPGDEHSANLDCQPALLQDCYPGRTIRCYVVDEQLVASAEILHGDAIDSSIEQRGVRPLSLPDDVVAAVLKAVRTLGLRFSGIDVQHDLKHDRFAILECNISPMFANFSRMTGIDIPGLLARLLMRLACQCAGGK